MAGDLQNANVEDPPDHCLELMREAIMCRGDLALTTFRWLPDDPPHLTAEALGWHTCVEWESLMGWVRQRHVKVFEAGVVQGTRENKQ